MGLLSFLHELINILTILVLISNVLSITRYTYKQKLFEVLPNVSEYMGPPLPKTKKFGRHW